MFFGVIILAWLYLKLCLDCDKLLEVVVYVGSVHWLIPRENGIQILRHRTSIGDNGNSNIDSKE